LPGTLPAKEMRMCWSLMCWATGAGGGAGTGVEAAAAATLGEEFVGVGVEAGLLHATVVVRSPRAAAAAAAERFVLIGTSAAILFVRAQ
jgi:hypothetical protein